MSIKFLSAMLLCILIFGGCVSNHPKDLASTSVQAVDLRDQDIFGVRSPTQPRLLLKVGFVTATNLSRYVNDNSYSLGVSAFLCDRPGRGDVAGEDFVGLSFPDVYWRGIALTYDTHVEREQPEADQFIHYYFFINVAREETRWINERDVGFDLRADPQDVCFRLRGGNMGGFGYRSNIAVLPKAEIKRALEQLPPGFAN